MICATVTSDHVFPATANIISNKVVAVNAWSFDISAACSGFIYALTTAAQFIETGKYKKVVVVGADKMSSIIDYIDRATCIIFGDGAGAILLEPSANGTGIIDCILRSDGGECLCVYQKAGGSVKRASHTTVENPENYLPDSSATMLQTMLAKELAWENQHRQKESSDNHALMDSCYSQPMECRS